MNDEERRGWIVKWMRGAGEAWLLDPHLPAAGSDLAADDATKPTVSDVVAYGIASAIDHLGSVVDAMMSDYPIRHYAHFTTLRTGLLASSRATWTLTPDNSVERQLRSIQVRSQNVDEQRKAMNAISGTHLDAATEAAQLKAVAALDAELASLEGHALALGAAKLTFPKDTISMLRELVDANSWDGSAILTQWRTGSAAAHGYHWIDIHRPNPGVFDEMTFNGALYGTFLSVTAATTLYEKRSAAPTSP
ncbi:hypothetical protein [Mycolicibacterium frederiksbergense]|uniref:hypothetical protein n=1 Tax=Mycolicibacterium frederiksbergense TaxID=117567 RepID=UPI00399B4148